MFVGGEFVFDSFAYFGECGFYFLRDLGHWGSFLFECSIDWDLGQLNGRLGPVDAWCGGNVGD